MAGKAEYFGPWWGTAKQARSDYESRIVALREGRVQTPSGSGPDTIPVAELCNQFIADRKHRLEAGELTQGSFDDYFKTCERIVKAFTRKRLVADLTNEAFQKLRSKTVKKWGSPYSISNDTQRVRTVFKFGYDDQLLEKPVRFGVQSPEEKAALDSLLGRFDSQLSPA